MQEQIIQEIVTKVSGDLSSLYLATGCLCGVAAGFLFGWISYGIINSIINSIINKIAKLKKDREAKENHG